MGLGPRIDIRQSQSLVLTPQLTQAIKLLQLSNLELDAFIAEEMSKNPLIEAAGGEVLFSGSPRDLAPPPLATRQGERRRLAEMCQAEFAEQPLKPLMAGMAVRL